MRLNEPIFSMLDSGKKIGLLRFLLGHETMPDMSERELAKRVKMSNVAVNRAMAEFQGMNLVNVRRVGNANVWHVNNESYAYDEVKRLIFGNKTGYLPVESMKDMLVKYIKKLPVIQAVLFGSTARGDEKPNSDIDLFLLVRSQTEKKEVEKSLDELRDRILTIYGNVLSDYILTEKEYGEKQGLGVVKNIKKEGVRIV